MLGLRRNGGAPRGAAFATHGYGNAQEEQPRAVAYYEHGGDGEAPRRCGSAVDKVWLLPFSLFLGGVFFYGTQGIRDFNLYEQGEVFARKFCEPLASLEGSCRGPLTEQVAKATASIDSSAMQTLESISEQTSSVQSQAAGACDSLSSTVQICETLGAQASVWLVPLPALPTLKVSDAAASSGEQVAAVQSQWAGYVASVEANCSALVGRVSGLCAQLDTAFEQAFLKLDPAIAFLTAQVGQVKDPVDQMLAALNETVRQVCPSLGHLGEACDSLEQSIEDTIHEALASAVRSVGIQLPDVVPKDWLDSTLQSIADKAAAHVGELCGQATNLSSHCEALLDPGRWTPLLEMVSESMNGLPALLATAESNLRDTMSTQCEAAQEQCAEACAAAATQATAALASVSAYAENATATAQGAADMALEQVGAMWESLDSRLGVLKTFVGTLQGNCEASTTGVAGKCAQTLLVGSNISSLVQRVANQTAYIRNINQHLVTGCGNLGRLQEQCLSLANPCAIIQNGAVSLWQLRSSEIVYLLLYLLATNSVVVFFLLCIIQFHTRSVVTVSIILNLGNLLCSTIFYFVIANYPTAMVFGTFFLLKALWYWCVRGKIAFAVRIIHCSVEALRNLLGLSVWIFGIFIIGVQAAVVALCSGAFFRLTGPNAPEEAVQLEALLPGATSCLVLFALVWIVEVLSNVLHVTVCCALGGRCGIDTPASSTCGAALFALTGGLGSICAGSFWIAFLKTFEYFIGLGEDSDNIFVKCTIKVACCAVQTVVKMYNSYAFVFVGLKGESYCEAAVRTFEVLSADGLAAVATDQALHDVMHTCKQVALWSSLLIAFLLGRSLGLIGFYDRSWQEIIVGPLLCMCLASVVSYVMTLTMGRLVEACCCTLMILYEDPHYRQLMTRSQAHICQALDEVTEGGTLTRGTAKGGSSVYTDSE